MGTASVPDRPQEGLSLRRPMRNSDIGAPLMKTVQLAELLQVSRRTICLWAETGEMPAIRVGKQWRFRRRDVAAWIGGRSLHRCP
jgi:excisionase family DNA binding protein